MRSGRAHGYLIAGLINEHLYPHTSDEDIERYQLEEATGFCPECCGPCAALAEYFNTTRGRAEADAYILALPKSPHSSMNYDWQLEDGRINWDMVEEWMKLGWCPNHEEALHQQGQAEGLFSE